jgi:uncharacterized protein
MAGQFVRRGRLSSIDGTQADTYPGCMFPWKTAIVTGASAGIGEAITNQLTEQGVRTIAVARRGDRLDALAALSPLVEPLVADLLTPEGIDKVRARLVNTDDPIDLLVNNAGFGAAGRVSEISRENALGMIDLNIRALTELTHVALPWMLARDRGWILQVSSVASFQPGPNAAIYSATKAFVTSFTEALHEELRGTNVKVSALCPGFTKTEFHEVSSPGTGPAKVPEFAWLAANDVAASGLKALAAGRALDVPGALYKGLGALTNSLPRSLTRRIMGLTAKNVKY